MIEVHRFVFNPFAENTYILAGESGICAILDPGCFDDEERKILVDFITAKGLRPEFVLNTHCHIDHIFGNRFLTAEYGIPLIAPRGEDYNMQRAIVYSESVGLDFQPSPEPDTWLTAGGQLTIGKNKLEVLFTPGHSAGHLSFFHGESGKLFSGDVLFRGSIGRTDLPGGNFDTLMKVIREVLMPVGDHATVYPGHGEETTIGAERKSNPFLLQDV